jgi:hypothetical protein
VFDQVQVTRQVRHRSVSGTADLVVDLLEGRSPAARLLIENKLEAGFTSDQPRRYAASKRGFLATQIAPVVVTVLVCPATYRAASRGAAGFEVVLTYEEIVRWLDPAGQRVLSAALRRASLPYEAEDAPEVSSFFDGYRRLAAETAPELVVKPNPNSNNARPRGSRTIYFAADRILMRYHGLPTLRFSHQCLDRGAPSASVKIMLAGWARHVKLISEVASFDLAGTGFYVRRAAESLAIVADTPSLDNSRAAETQLAAIVKGLDAARRLRAWFNSNSVALNAWARFVDAHHGE